MDAWGGMLDTLAGAPALQPEKAAGPRRVHRLAGPDERTAQAHPKKQQPTGHKPTERRSQGPMALVRLSLSLADAAALERHGGGEWLRAQLAEERERMERQEPQCVAPEADAADDLLLTWRKPAHTPTLIGAQAFADQLSQFVQATNQAEADLGPGGAQAAAAIHRAKHTPT